LFYDTEFFQKKGALQTWSFNWSGSLAYRFVERWRLAFNWAYNYVFDDDTLGGAKPGDRDCWTVGPRLDFQATDKVSMNLGYSYADGPSHFNAQTVRVGVGIQF
jgi:long-subunit fatty acid transport protein